MSSSNSDHVPSLLARVAPAEPSAAPPSRQRHRSHRHDSTTFNPPSCSQYMEPSSRTSRRERKEALVAERGADQGGSPPHLSSSARQSSHQGASSGVRGSRARRGENDGRRSEPSFGMRDHSTAAATSSSSSPATRLAPPAFSFPRVRRSPAPQLQQIQVHLASASSLPSSHSNPNRHSPASSQQRFQRPQADNQQLHQQSRTAKPPKVDPFATYPVFDYRTYDPSQIPVVRYASTVQAADEALRELGDGPLALDLEWKPCYRKGEPEHPTALVQLGDSRVIVLVQLTRMNRAVPSELIRILEDGLILKLGVGIHEDAKKMLRDTGVQTRGCLDLNDIAWREGPAKMTQGLAKWSGLYLHRKLTKGKAQRSDWSAPLTAIQQQYAANDVYSTICVFQALRARALASTPLMDAVWPLPIGKAGGNYVNPPIDIDADAANGGWSKGGAGAKWEFRWESMRVERS